MTFGERNFFFHSAYSLWNITDRLETVSAMPSSRASSWSKMIRKMIDQGSNSGLLCLLHCKWIGFHWVTREAPLHYMYVCMYIYIYIPFIAQGFCGGSVVKNPPASGRDAGSIPGLGRSSGGGNHNPLQYPSLGNPIDRRAWWATVHGVTEELDTT